MPDYKLVICSSGEETRKLRYLAKDFPNITFTGHLGKEKYFEIIKSSLAAIYVPTNEDFGISALEALGLGVPLIHTCSGGLNEICNNKVTIPVDDDDIENQLFEIISDYSAIDWAKQKQVSSPVIDHEFQSFATNLKILLKEELGINV
jgi:glycosyltransferase involved in cell wall biosynthesis